MSDTDFDSWANSDVYRVANAIADAARKVILPYFRQADLLTDNKDVGGYDPVTAADRAAEQAMRAVVRRERPHDSILGEEFGAYQGSSGLTWVLDPIDGTRGFVSGTPTWGVLIALSSEKGPVFGLIDQPYIGERFIGGGAHAELVGPLGQSKLSTRAPRALSDATILTTFPEVGSEDEGRAFHAVSEQTKLTRYGMDCYGYALLAAGQVDLVIEAGLQPYDIHAPIALVEAAGGIVTDWDGNPAHNGGRALAAANADIHEQALRILRASLA